MKKSIKAFFTLSAIAVGTLVSSCDSVIFDDQGDCSVHYSVPVVFKENHYGINVISAEVTKVTMYVYDDRGEFVMSKTESGESLRQPDYKMELELPPGRYSMLVWAEGTPSCLPATSFDIGGGGIPTAISDLSATLPLMTDADGALFIDRDLVPLYHGYLANVEFPDTYGNVVLPELELMKDTHIINVSLENMEGTEIAPDALTVSIEADNSRLDWQNIPLSEPTFSYRPWCVTQLSSERPDESRSDGTLTHVTGLFTELTVNRLMATSHPILVVHRNFDNKDIIRLDLVEFLCMVKGHFPHLVTNQEYLDWTDRHTLSFFIDADLNWYIAGGININGWKVVPPQEPEF